MTAAATSRASCPVRRIADDTEALGAAQRLADGFRDGAARRDAERLLPLAELDSLSASGLLPVTVPAAYGGAAVGTTAAEVFRLLASADPSLARIPQGHFAYVNGPRPSATSPRSPTPPRTWASPAR